MGALTQAPDRPRPMRLRSAGWCLVPKPRSPSEGLLSHGGESSQPLAWSNKTYRRARSGLTPCSGHLSSFGRELEAVVPHRGPSRRKEHVGLTRAARRSLWAFYMSASPSMGGSELRTPVGVRRSAKREWCGRLETLSCGERGEGSAIARHAASSGQVCGGRCSGGMTGRRWVRRMPLLTIRDHALERRERGAWRDLTAPAELNRSTPFDSIPLTPRSPEVSSMGLDSQSLLYAMLTPHTPSAPR